MSEAKPILVIVNGPPAAGKTSIVEQLAKRLNLPLFTKDFVKELFANELGSPALDFSHELGRASQLMLAAIASELVNSGQGLVVESFFHKGVTEPQYEPLIQKTNAILVHITADEETLVSRYAKRMNAPDRHEIHNTEGTPDELRKVLREGLGDPLDLDCPLIILDTTEREYDEVEVANLIRSRLAETTDSR